jgi:hypothetical protein
MAENPRRGQSLLKTVVPLMMMMITMITFEKWYTKTQIFMSLTVK